MGSNTINLDVASKTILPANPKLGGKSRDGSIIEVNNYFITLNGKPFFPICAEFHFSRCPADEWEGELLKMSVAGVNIISTYLFWNHHEEDEGEFDWAGDRDARRFLKLCSAHGLYVMLRIGPFAHGEARNGGLPDWLYGRPFDVRSNDGRYLFYVKRFYEEIGRQVSGLLFRDNGPVIGIQLENEHLAASAPWDFLVVNEYEWVHKGRDGAEHIRALRTLAMAAGLDVPIYTCTGWDGGSYIEEETLPVFGGYCWQPWSVNDGSRHKPSSETIFRDFHEGNFKSEGFSPSSTGGKYPYVCSELGGGMACWYKYRFVVELESVLAATLTRIAGGCNSLGYYMFHDGTNPIGRHGYLNERVVPKISYNFQAPIGEYGQIRDSYRMLKPVFYFLKEVHELLCPMGTVLPEGSGNITAGNTSSLRYAARQKNGSGFLFLVNYQDHAEMAAHKNIVLNLDLPGETLSIPSGEGFTLEEGVSAILPFNLKLGSVLLKYATTQLITSVRDGNESTFFFFSPEGMESQYCFDVSGIDDINVQQGSVAWAGSLAYVSVQPGTGCVITLAGSSGESLKICTLTCTQALSLWTCNLRGRDRVLLSNSDITVANNAIHATSRGNAGIDLSIFPRVHGLLATQHGCVEEGTDGIFSAFHIELPAAETNIHVKMESAGKATIQLPAEGLGQLDDILLQIDYLGSVGNAFIDGKLIADNFCNGEVWEIGLKRFCAAMREKEMYIHIVPFHRNGEVVFEPGIKFRHEFRDGETAEIFSITAVPVYSTRITLPK